MDVRDIILKFPDQIKAGLELGKDFKLNKYKRIVICGMGGSIIPADIFVLFAGHKHLKTSYEIWKDYDLHPSVSTDDLVICISWSGTTEETISSCQTATTWDIDTLVITKGGELADLAKKNNIPSIILPQDKIPPRFAIGYMTGVLFSVLGYGDQLINLKLNPAELENEGNQLADKISGNIPLFYTSYPWRKLNAFWKALFNENCKTHAFSNTFPILTHNELEGFAGSKKDFYPIIFREANPDPRIERNYKAAIAIFERMGYNYSIVNLSSGLSGQEEAIPETALNNYILGLWTSYHLAKNLGADPEDIKLIEEFKQLKKSF